MPADQMGGPDMAPHTPQRSSRPGEAGALLGMPLQARRIAAAAAFVVVLGLAILVPQLGDYYVHVFALVFTNVILAASLRPSLTCGQLNIGHSAFMCVGAYTSALLAKHWSVPFEVSLLSGALLAALVGLAVGYPSLFLLVVLGSLVPVVPTGALVSSAAKL